MNWNAYWRLMRFDKPIGILLLLWPTLWALLIAGEGQPQWHNIVVFVTGVVLMRAAGCIVNDIADRNFDGHVTRTRTRPIAAGEITVRQALTLCMALLLAAFLLVLTTNRMTVLLALAALLLAATYPFFKRFTHLPQLVLGLAFSWGMLMAFTAEREALPMLAWILLAANFFWTVFYDTLYAMVDREDDLKIGVKSTAILFGRHDLAVLRALVVVFLGLLVQAGLMAQLSLIYFLLLGLAALLLVLQLWRVRNRNEQACFKAFQNNHWVGLIITAGLLLHYHWPLAA